MVREDAAKLPPEVLAFIATLENIPVPLHAADGPDAIPPGAKVYWTTGEEWAKFQNDYATARENFMRWFLYEVSEDTFAKGFVGVSGE